MKEASRKTAVTLFIFRFFRLLVSITTLSVSAHFFGVGLDRESWILSLNFVVVVQLALWGPLNETFRAKFIFLKAEEGAPAALHRTASLLLFSLSVMAGVVLIMELFAGNIAAMIAPSFTGVALDKLTLLLRYLLWSAVLSQATQLLSSVLNTYDSFYIPEISGFISAIINLALIVLLSDSIGIYSFLIANYASALLLLLALVYQIKKLKIPLFEQKISFSWQQVRPFILYSIPFFLPYIIGQCNSLIEKLIANLLANNTVSIIDYSKKISDIIQTVLTSVLATIMVPTLSSKFSAGNVEGVGEESKKYLQLIFLMLAFIMPMLVLCSDDITAILYNKGTISAHDLALISRLIKLYAISLLSIFSYLIFGLILLSVNKNRQYALYGMIAQIIMILINVAAYRLSGIYTFVIALTVSHFVSACILCYHLPFDKKVILGSVFRYGLLIFFVLCGAYLVNLWVYSPGNPFVHIAYNCVLVGGLCGSLALLLRLPEVQALKSIIFKNR